MKTGGENSTAITLGVIRIAGLVIPIALVIYGLLIQAGYINSQNYLNDHFFVTVALSWLATAAIFYLWPPRTVFMKYVSIAIYFVLGAAFSLFVSGLNTPFMVSWLLLIIAAYVYLDRRGAEASIAGFAAIVAVDALILHPNDTNVQINNITIMITLLVSSLALVVIQRSQKVDQATLDNAIAQEGIERERLLTLVNNIADAILSVDSKGVIRVYNAACLNLLDTNGSLNGHHIDEVLDFTDPDGKKVVVSEELKNTRTVTTRDDLRYKLSDDETMRIEATLSPIRSNYSRSKSAEEFDGYIVILRDVTKTKSLEEERDEFISVVSHELRTPVTIVEGSISNAQYLLAHGTDKKNQTKALEMAHEQTIFLARMINDLSTLSRAERGVADASELIDVKELASGLYEEYAPQAEEKKLHLNLDLGPHLGHVNASRLYLHELIQNFITNSIKYTNEGSVTLSIHATKGRVTFAVKDTGIGISRGDRDKIFDKFYRAEDYRTRETSGTGLGLYVSAKLAKKLDCKISLQSRLNHGSTFSFSLPQANTKLHKKTK